MQPMQMSAKRRLSDASRDASKLEIKQKKQRVEAEDPPAAWIVADPFDAGTVKCGVDPFDIGRTVYNDCVPDASRQLRKSTVIETNRNMTWFLPAAKYNCAEAWDAWEPLYPTPAMHSSREPLVVRLIEQFLPVKNRDEAPLAELVFSYIRGVREISYLELWCAVRTTFNEQWKLEARQVLNIASGTVLADTFDYSAIVEFCMEPSYDGETMVIWPVFELVHKV